MNTFLYNMEWVTSDKLMSCILCGNFNWNINISAQAKKSFRMLIEMQTNIHPCQPIHWHPFILVRPFIHPSIHYTVHPSTQSSRAATMYWTLSLGAESTIINKINKPPAFIVLHSRGKSSAWSDHNKPLEVTFMSKNRRMNKWMKIW